MYKKIIINEKQFSKILESNKLPCQDRKSLLYYGLINEGLIMTYPFEQTQKFVSDMLDIEMYNIRQAKSANNVDCIFVYLDLEHKDNKSGLSNLDRAMNACGYFKSITQYNENDNEMRILYEPKNEKENTDLSLYKYIIHITPIEKLSKIKTNGLCPKTNNRIWKYPDRVYVFGVNDEEEIGKNVLYLSNQNSEEYAAIQIDNEVVNNIKFYKDPNFNNGFYTNENIHPNFIKNVSEYNINLLKQKYNVY